MKYEKGYIAVATLTRKQVNVIYANAKRGNIRIERWFMAEMYDLVDMFQYTDEEDEKIILSIIEHLFRNEYEKAQKIINEYQELRVENTTPITGGEYDRRIVA